MLFRSRLHAVCKETGGGPSDLELAGGIEGRSTRPVRRDESERFEVGELLGSDARSGTQVGGEIGVAHFGTTTTRIGGHELHHR